jgi:crotonobetainyl-CoA:carnitine CoA-transferase CaiB-like acyl-CoA transferase
MDMNYLVSGTPPRRAGNAHQNIVPYEVFRCADGHLILGVGNDGQFAKFCEIAGIPEWAADPRFAKNADRVRNRDTLVPMVAAVILTRPQRAWLEALERAGVPCGPIAVDQVRRLRRWPRGAWARAAPARGQRPQVATRCASRRRPSLTSTRRRCAASTRRRCCASASRSTTRRFTGSRRAG